MAQQDEQHRPAADIMEKAQPTQQVETTADRRITLRFKSSEWAIIESDIAATGLNRNAYFRELALDAPVPRKTRQRAGGEGVKITAKFIGQLGKVGSNLNQLAKQANIACKSGEWATMPSVNTISENVAATHQLLLSIKADLTASKRPAQRDNSEENCGGQIFIRCKRPYRKPIILHFGSQHHNYKQEQNGNGPNIDN